MPLRTKCRHVLSLVSAVWFVGLSVGYGFAATYTYDPLNRLTSVVYSPSLSIDYTYDAAGNLIEERINKAIAVTIAAQANPPVGGTLVVSPNKPRYLAGENVTLIASPAPLYSFGSWSGVAGCSTNPVCAVNVGTVNIDAIANFTANPASCSLVSGLSVAPASSVTQSYSATCINTTAYVWTLNGTSLPACTTSNCAISFPTNASTATVPFTVQVAPASTPSASASLAVTQAGASVCTSIAGITTVPNQGGSFSWTAACLNTSAYVWTINDQPSTCTGATCQISFVGIGSQSASVYTIKVAPANAPTAIASIVVSQTGVSACNSLTGPTTIGPAAGSQTYSASCANTAGYVWTLDGATLAACTTASCAVAFGANTGTTTVNHAVQVTPANNVSATASLAVAQTGVSTCTAISGPSSVAASAGSQSYSATCANTSTYLWTLDGVTIAACTGTTCNVPFAANTSTTSVARSLKVAPSNNVASFATLAITQAGASVCSSLGGPVSVVASANSQSYTATCANTSTFSWTLDGAAIPACTGATCSVAFTANGATTTVNHTVQVAPSNNLTAAASLAVAQAGASACSSVSGPTSLSASAGSQSYSATCTNTTAYVWSLNGTAIPGCTSATCAVSFPANAATTTVALTVQVAPSNAPTAIASIAVTQAGASACTAISGPTTVGAAGGNVTWTASCANTSAYVWTLDNQPTSCNTATCQLAIAANTGQTAASHTIKVSPANAATSVASLVFSQTGASACNSVTGPTAIGSAASSQTYTASCANTSSYVWTLDGVVLPACTTISCAVSFAANAVTTAANHTVQVAPANNSAATAGVAVVQAGASACTAVGGPTNVSATASTQTYTATCANTTTFAWTLNGSPVASCTGATCSVAFATNTATTALPFSVGVAPANALTAVASLAGTQAGASVCTSIAGPTSFVAGGASVSLTATCANTSTYVWMLNNQPTSCTGVTCPLTFAANTTQAPITHTVKVAPTNAPTMVATLVMTQAGVAACNSVTGPTTIVAAASSQTYVASCANTAAYAWTLDGVAVPSCTTASCVVNFATNSTTTTANHSVQVAPSTNLTAAASIAVAQTGASACTAVSGPTSVPAVAGTQTYSATCPNTSAYAWSLNGAVIAACTTATCAVAFPANTATSTVPFTVQVAPSTAPTASASLAVTQSGASVCTAISGPATLANAGGSFAWTAICANTTTYVWTLNNSPTTCSSATCILPFGANSSQSAATYTLRVSPVNVQTSIATLVLSQTGVSACNSVTGPTTVSAPASSQTYSANCANTASYVWTLDGATVPSCTTASCSVNFGANASASSASHTVQVAPSNNVAALASIVVSQSGASMCTSVSGSTSVASVANSQTYSATCANTTEFVWSLNGATIAACSTVSCAVAFPVNTSTSTVPFTVRVAPASAPANSANLVVTQAGASVCTSISGPTAIANAGGGITWTANCANTSAYSWTLDNQPTPCTGSSCQLNIAPNASQSPVSRTIRVSPANAPTALASLVFAQAGLPACNSVTGPTTIGAAGGNQTYTANCANTTSFVWSLNGTTVSGCTAATCAIAFTANSGITPASHAVQVAPANNLAAPTSLTVTQAGAALCSAVSGASSVPAAPSSQSYSATCANTVSYQWSLDGVVIANCSGATCAVTYSANAGTAAATHTVQVTPSTNTSGAASLVVTQAAPLPSCSSVSGAATVAPLGATQLYTANCVGTANYVWSLDGTNLPGCTSATCSVVFADNTGIVPLTHIVRVAPTSALLSFAEISVSQGLHNPTCSSIANWLRNIPFSGGTFAYTISCTSATSYVWTLNGAPLSCNSPACDVAFPPNGTQSPVVYTLGVAASGPAGSAQPQPINITVAAARACSLDFNGDGAISPPDALLFNRWLIGFRGMALVEGVTPTPSGTSAASFADAVAARMAALSVAHDFDGNGRVEAMTDGLLFTRFAQGLVGPTVTAQALGAGAQRSSYDAIRQHVNTSCGATFASSLVPTTLAKLSDYKYGDVWRDGGSTWALGAKVVDANDVFVRPDGAKAVRHRLYLLGLVGYSLAETALGEAYLQDNTFSQSAVRPQPASPNDIEIFWNEKRANGTYVMAGVRSVVSRNTLTVSARTDLFVNQNMGWYPWLAEDGLHHFNYGGGAEMLNTTTVGPSTQPAFLARWNTERGLHSGSVVPAPTDVDVATRLCAIHCLPEPSFVIDTSQAALTALNASFPVATAFSFITGVGGRPAVKFNGLSNPSAIRIPNSPGMQFTTEATIDLWARIDGSTGMSGANGQGAATGWAMALVAKSHDAGSVSINAFANDANYSGSGYGFAAWASAVSGWGAGTCSIINRNPGAALGTWFRITAVASTTGGTRIYHSKQLIYSCSSAVPNFTGMNAQDLYIGKYRDTWYPLNGAVQDIRIYQKALTDVEIQALPYPQ